MDKKIIIALVIAVVVVLGGIYFASGGTVGTKTADAAKTAFAQCLTDKGAKMFGAWWCPHCAEEKRIFGDSFQKVNYVECATPDGKGQTQVCKDNNIKGYPTWQFADGSREEGVMTFAELAEKTGCTLPEDTEEATSATGTQEGVSSSAVIGTTTSTSTTTGVSSTASSTIATTSASTSGE